MHRDALDLMGPSSERGERARARARERGRESYQAKHLDRARLKDPVERGRERGREGEREGGALMHRRRLAAPAAIDEVLTVPNNRVRLRSPSSPPSRTSSIISRLSMAFSMRVRLELLFCLIKRVR
jgi:hypothetical protein